MSRPSRQTQGRNYGEDDGEENVVIGQKVCKEFDAGWFEGTVVKSEFVIDSSDEESEVEVYRVEYEDGDCEDLKHAEVSEILANERTLTLVAKRRRKEEKLSEIPAPSLRKKNQKPPETTTTTTTSSRKKPRKETGPLQQTTLENAFQRPRRERKRVNYAQDESSESEDDSKPPAKSKRRVAEEDDVISIASSTQEDADDDVLVVDEEEDEDGDVSEEEIPKKRGRKTTRAAKKQTGKAKPDKAAAATGKPDKKKMSESFEPINYPYYKEMPLKEIQETKEFLDSCGMEATDDIIDRLVGEQVDKVGSLLQGAFARGELGSKKNPLQLGTACSGTDAPSLALTLVKEQMEKRGLDKVLDFEHTFSCEVDPFKQAYLARNFDSILYPDIAKLTDETPRDVFGQEQKLPAFSLFVAGTSCKNFSMLRSTRRIDIEDKGCSGETFLAATETLFKEKPDMGIFENVIGAPWAKMQEYITGRVKLSECDSKKAIKEIKNAKKELVFVKDKDNNIVVDEVPAIYGVRCGAIVEGFLRPGSNSPNPVSWPRGKSKTCTLTDIIKANNISKKDDVLVFQTECVYCTHIVKVDTKEYGLPQTRMRTYMFVWRPENDDVNDDLGQYWEAIVKHLKSPVRHSLQSFILQVDHDIIRVFREALKGPPGRRTVRAVCLEPDFWKSANANLPHNQNVRKKLGMEDTARFTTSWQAFGKKQIPPHYWLEYMKCNFARETDLLDILNASAMRDAECHDPSFSSFYWNVSQNASKEKHRSACPGIAGCITPGGDFFLPQEGRPILGCEKLMIQGIPYFRLALGNETEVQLGDLAGNAMSLTVVCATMLGAMAAGELRRLTQESSHGSMEKILACISRPRKCLIPESPSEAAEVCKPSADASSDDALQFFNKLASMAPAAVSSSILCTCETSGSDSRTCEFLQCKVCRVSCCRNCISATAGYNLSSHETEEVHVSSKDHGIGHFQAMLREIVPPSIVFNEEGINEIAEINSDMHRVKGLSAYTFSLHRIKRERRKWSIIYRAGDNYGVGESLAEFRIAVGELQTEEASRGRSAVELGMKGELTSFIPAKVEPLVYGPLQPCAVVTVKHGSNIVSWRGCFEDKTVALHVEGEGATDSFRVELGLTEASADALVEYSKKPKNQKHFLAAKNRAEERRWCYPENWQVWPENVHIRTASDMPIKTVDSISGTYKRAQCRQTTNQSALWVKERSPEETKPLYLLIQPNVSRTGSDRAIVSSSISHEDSSSIMAILPCFWQPCDALTPKLHKVNGVLVKQWKILRRVICAVPPSNITVDSAEDSDILVSVKGLNQSEVSLLCRNTSSNEDEVQLNVSSGQKAQQTIRMFHSVCATAVLKHTARNDFKYDLKPSAQFRDILPADPSLPFGCCKKTIPERPSEQWFFDKERSAWDRRSEPGASRNYYLALESAPQPFQLWVKKQEGTLEIKYSPSVVAHRAAFQLCEGRGGRELHNEVGVQYRLTDVTQQKDPVITPFKVSNCESEEPTEVGLKSPYGLYERQQKVVSKMLAVERMETDFEEVELSEQEIPSCGISLIAKATRNRKIRGGVIADAIGSGKTVVSIAMILNGLANARKSGELPNRSGATLVVVPPALIDQWASEIRKFSPVHLNVVKIYDFKTLRSKSVQSIIASDVVICPIDILESPGYMECLVKSANLKDMKEVPTLPSHSGQIEQSEARGVWIPATSADPYAGANNSNNQKRRNQSAYYTFVYLQAIEELRKQKFGESTKGVPLEFFEWERVIVDEIHESLCTTRNELKLAKDKDENNKTSSGFFKEKNRRAGRELLGITEKDIQRRPLVFRRAIYGLTGTPLLDSGSRVIELANLMGNTYISGLSSHWRKLERESCRDIFLHNYLEPKQSREVRSNMHSKCQDYLRVACCRNKTGEEMDGISLVNHQRSVRMTEKEKVMYLSSQSGIPSSKKSLSIKPEDFDVTAGHDISRFLRQNASLPSRSYELVKICEKILATEDRTKIIVFVDGRVQAGNAACTALKESGIGCTLLNTNDSVETKNRKISWYQTGDATSEDRARPRVLVLNFEHAAGLNLQTECHHLILFSPLYVGEGGSSSDPVADASTELQAIGRVFRPGQTAPEVHVYRIEVQGPDGEDALDGQIIRRNTDEATIAMAVNAGE